MSNLKTMFKLVENKLCSNNGLRQDREYKSEYKKKYKALC